MPEGCTCAGPRIRSCLLAEPALVGLKPQPNPKAGDQLMQSLGHKEQGSRLDKFRAGCCVLSAGLQRFSDNTAAPAERVAAVRHSASHYAGAAAAAVLLQTPCRPQTTSLCNFSTAAAPGAAVSPPPPCRHRAAPPPPEVRPTTRLTGDRGVKHGRNVSLTSLTRPLRHFQDHQCRHLHRQTPSLCDPREPHGKNDAWDSQEPYLPCTRRRPRVRFPAATDGFPKALSRHDCAARVLRDRPLSEIIVRRGGAMMAR